MKAYSGKMLPLKIFLINRLQVHRQANRPTVKKGYDDDEILHKNSFMENFCTVNQYAAMEC